MGIFGRLFAKKQSKDRMTEGKFWKCPQCGAILRKTIAGPFAPGARIIGTATCNKCGTQFSQQDVYDGKYDVAVQVTTEKPSVACPFLDPTGKCVPPGQPERAVPCSFTGDSYEFDCNVYPTLVAQKVQLEEKEKRLAQLGKKAKGRGVCQICEKTTTLVEASLCTSCYDASIRAIDEFERTGRTKGICDWCCESIPAKIGLAFMTESGKTECKKCAGNSIKKYGTF